MKNPIEFNSNGLKAKYVWFVRGILKDLMEGELPLETCCGEIVKAHRAILKLETDQLKNFESKYRKKRSEWREEKNRLEAAEDELKKKLDDVKEQESEQELEFKKKMEELAHREQVLDQRFMDFRKMVGVQTVAAVDRAREEQLQQMDKYIKHIYKITIDAGILEDMSIADISARVKDQMLRAEYFHRIETFLEKYRVLVETQCLQLENIACREKPAFVAEYQEQYFADRDKKTFNELKQMVLNEDSVVDKMSKIKKIMDDYSAGDYHMPPYFTREFFTSLGGELSERHSKPIREYMGIYLPIFETVEIVMRYMKNSSERQVREGYIALVIRYFKPGVRSVKEQSKQFGMMINYHGNSDLAMQRMFYRKVKSGVEVFSQLFWFILNPENARDGELRKIFDKMLEIIHDERTMDPEAYFEKALELSNKKFSPK